METELVLEKKVSASLRTKGKSVNRSKVNTLNNKLRETSNRPPPYHVFTVLDDYFVFDTSGCRFYKIDEITYAFLERCLSVSIHEAKAILLNEGKYSAQEINNVSQEIILLSENGLFDIPNFSLTSEEFDDLIDFKPGFMYSIELNLSDSCNMACKYCYLSACRNKQNKGLMSEEVIRQAIDMLFSLSGNRDKVNISFLGGEPLLNKSGFRFAINYSQAQGKKYNKDIIYTITTNGTLLSDDIIDDYINKYNIATMVSLDGDRDIHNAQCPMRDGGESYDLVMQGIKKITKNRKNIWVRCTMIPPVPDIKSLVKFYEKLGFGRIIIGCAINMIENSSKVDFTKNDYMDLAQQMEKLIPWLIKKRKTEEYLKYFPQRQYFQGILNQGYSSKPNKLKCGVCSLQVNVGYDGTLYPCNKYNGMKNWKVGHTSTGIDAIRCKKFWIDYNKITKNICSKCWAYPNTV